MKKFKQKYVDNTPYLDDWTNKATAKFFVHVKSVVGCKFDSGVIELFKSVIDTGIDRDASISMKDYDLNQQKKFDQLKDYVNDDGFDVDQQQVLWELNNWYITY